MILVPIKSLIYLYHLICIQINGKFMVPNDIADKLRSLLKINKIDKNIRWHDLRHTSDTLLLENGVAMKTIQKKIRSCFYVNNLSYLFTRDRKNG